MSFSFNATAGTSQSTAKPRLAGNEIYEVKFDGCEIQDIAGVKDPTAVYKVLKLRFSNEEGTFEHTIFEPRSEDFQRRETDFVNKNGNTEKIPQPSNVETMMLLFKHVIDAVAPSIGKQIDSKEKNLGAANWDDLRKLVAKILDTGKGISTKIKLLKNKNGEAIFPGYFTGLTKEGQPYVRNNFIGNKLAFTTYEFQKMNNQATAKPTSMDTFNSFESVSTPNANSLDLDFNVSDI